MTRRRKVLIVGGNVRNQGAFMMTVAAAQAIRSRLNAQPVVDGHFGTGNDRSWYGLQPLLGAQRLPIHLRGLSWTTRGKFGRLTPWAAENEISAVVDVSGFVFGDQWAHLNLQKRASYFSYWKSRGVPVYLLPQAFGPFERTSEAAIHAIRSSAITFVRDQRSLSHVMTLEGALNDSRIILAPDFTVLSGPEIPPDRSVHRLTGGVPIVPNWNTARRNSGSQSLYIDSLVTVIDELARAGLPRFGLSHEGDEDYAILKLLVQRRPGFEIVKGLNGLEAKWLIGQAPFIVSARFHAIVSALSQNVPAVMHGWSHKYHELASDYSVPKLVVDAFSPAENQEVIRQLSHKQSRNELVSFISERAAIQKARADEMWDLVQKDFLLRIAP